MYLNLQSESLVLKTMEDSKKSPIIERLVKFMEMSGLTSSQFADKAGIPRPSLSQMLHGRNKSLNNQVLAKLNDAFPELNIVWLLFGQGDMYTRQNIETSERQNQPNSFDFETADIDLKPLDSLFAPEKLAQNQAPNTSNDDSAPYSAPKKPVAEASAPVDGSPAQVQAIADSMAAAARKRIASIIVFYTDSSFETFYPSAD